MLKEDWNYKTMKDICIVNQGLQINISQREKYKKNDNKVYITIQHLNNIGENEYIRNKDHNESVVCNKNDILMTRTGNTGKVVTNVEGVFHNNFFKVNFDREKIDKDYLFYYLNMKSIQTLILAKAGTSTIPDLNHNDFYLIPFIFPNDIKEQKAVVRILKDIDSLIRLLENTIEKKKKIKNQAMMELLDIKNQKYKTITLNQIGYTYSGLSGMNSSNFTGGNKQYITFLNILNNPVVKEEFFGKFHCDNIQNKVQKGDLFFNTSSETPEEVAMCATIDYDVENVYLNSFCFGFRINDKSVDNKYLAYFFRSQYGRNIMKTIAQGSTRFNLPKEKFLNYKIQIPADINRQIEIAEILSNMDNEIEILNIKLDKYKLIKEGMMEDLLTGKVRLNYE